MRSLALWVLLSCGLGLWGEQPRSASQLPEIKVEGALPAVLKIRVKTASLGDAVLPSGVRRPSYVAPSAVADGRGEYSALPGDLSFYAGLTERGNTAPQALLDTLEARFETGPSAHLTIDTTQGDVLVGPALAKKLHLEGAKGTTAALVPFRVGPVTFRGVEGRLVGSAELPGESVDGVLPLSLFAGYGLFWESSAERLTVCAAGGPPPPAAGSGAFSTTAQWRDGALCLAVVLHGRYGGYFLVNPAQPHSAIDIEAARKAGIEVRMQGSVLRNEIAKGGLAEEARVRLGTAEVTIRWARVVDVAPYLPPACLGIMGRDVFTLFSYYIEPGSGTVVLTPSRKGGAKGR